MSIGTIYDDNAFRTYSANSDYITQLSGYLGRQYQGEAWQGRLYYRGNCNVFTRFRERNYLLQQAGLAASKRLGEKRNALFLGLNGLHRANRDLYSYYNFAEAKLFGNARVYLAPATFAQFGYSLRGRWYANLESFSNYEHFLFARFSHSFPSRTTLVVESNYGRKTYLNELTVETAGGLPAENSSDHYGQHRGGRGHTHGGQMDGGENTVTSFTRPHAAQWVNSIRLAQSLTSNTGISVEISFRRNSAEATRYLAGQVAGYTSEDELFDDRYGYESEEISLTLTQLLPLQLSLKTGSGWQWKNYPNRPALDLEGNPLPTDGLRNDRRLESWISLSKPIVIGNEFSVDSIGEFNLIDNHSNDAFYNYRSSAVTMGIGISF